MQHQELREKILQRLSSGLVTEVWPRAGASQEVNEIIRRLQIDAEGHLDEKLVIAGFTDHTITADEMEQACATCMYFQIHARFCDLPELMLPVEPHWSCRLWRI